LGSYPVEEMPNFYYYADMMLLTLKDELIFSFTVPGKLQSYLASKKPVAAMINGELLTLLEEADVELLLMQRIIKNLQRN